MILLALWIAFSLGFGALWAVTGRLLSVSSPRGSEEPAAETPVPAPELERVA